MIFNNNEHAIGSAEEQDIVNNSEEFYRILDTVGVDGIIKIMELRFKNSKLNDDYGWIFGHLNMLKKINVEEREVAGEVVMFLINNHKAGKRPDMDVIMGMLMPVIVKRQANLTINNAGDSEEAEASD